MHDGNARPEGAPASDGLGSRARTAIGWKVVSQGLTIGVQMITSVVLARLLMPNDFGILGMATMVTGAPEVRGSTPSCLTSWRSSTRFDSGSDTPHLTSPEAHPP